jgi:uncharacterized membrane protein YidH (DUF202 family)
MRACAVAAFTLIGVAIGAVAGGVVGYGLSEEQRRSCDTCNPGSRMSSALGVGEVGALALGAFGVVIGRFVLGEQWQVVAGR